MIPESYIVSIIFSLWVENFPENHDYPFPKGLVKRVSMNAIKTKDNIVSGIYNTRISLVWYDINVIGFDTQMAALIDSMDSLIDSYTKIHAVTFEGRTNGYDDSTDAHVMNLDFIVKHTI